MAASRGQAFTQVRLRTSVDGQQWLIAIHNKVYDVTRFMDEHPGGRELVRPSRGANGTQPFTVAGHSSDAWELLESFCIGEMEADERFRDRDIPPELMLAVCVLVLALAVLYNKGMLF